MSNLSKCLFELLVDLLGDLLGLGLFMLSMECIIKTMIWIGGL